MDRGQRPTVAQAWAYIREHVDYERLDMFQKKRYRLFECCAVLERYRDLPMHDYVNIIDSAMGDAVSAPARGTCPPGSAISPFAART